MNTHTRSRFLAWLLLVAMVLTMLPTAAFAAEAATYTKITTMEELTSGQYVMVVNTGYGPGVYENGWITAQAIDAGSDTVTGSVLPWTITVDGDTVKLTDSNGVAAAPKGGNNNGIVAGEYSWLVTCTDGTFQFAGQGVDTVLLASNKGAENKFRAYKSATVSGNPAGYPSEFTLYKLSGGTPIDPTDPVDPTDPTDPTEPEEPVLSAGDHVVIYNPANGKALSTSYTGFYNKGTDVTLSGGVLSGFPASDVWTVGVDGDGNYTFSTADGKKLSMGAEYTSTPLDDVNTGWKVLPAATEGCYYIQNAVRGNYLEWYGAKDNWSSSLPRRSTRWS